MKAFKGVSGSHDNIISSFYLYNYTYTYLYDNMSGTHLVVALNSHKFFKCDINKH